MWCFPTRTRRPILFKGLWERVRRVLGQPDAPVGRERSAAPLAFTLTASELPGGTWASIAKVEAGLNAALAGRYEVLRLIGRGGMSSVFLARDLRHGREVALKVLFPERDAEAGPGRFLEEIRVTAGLQHPNILPLFDSGEAGECLYYVMPLVDGESLHDRLGRERPLPIEEVRSVVGAVARALDHAHERGIVHRDIKPGNVLLGSSGIYVADFGISLALEGAGAGGRLTRTGTALGTPVYMSPEQIEGTGAVDGRADVYALGCVAYEMLTGEPPFSASTPRALMLRHLHDTPPPATTLRERVGAGVDAALAKALAKAPADRFGTAGAFAAALDAALRSPAGDRAPTSGRPTSGLQQEIRFCRTPDGVQLAYAVSGQGLPLVKTSNWLSHLEFDASSPLWHHWWAALSAEHRLVRYDERGSGLSDRKVDRLGLEEWVHDLETVVDAAGLDRFVLLGVSRGGAIAIEYAARHPERVSRLVLHGAYCVGRLARATPEGRQIVKMEVDMVRLGWGQANPAFRQAFTTLFFPEATADQMQWFNELQRVSATPDVAARMLEASFHFDVRSTARTVTVPTLVSHCTGDARVPFEEGRRIAGLVPGARFVSLESANHLPLEHEPAWGHFLAEFRRFTA